MSQVQYLDAKYVSGSLSVTLAYWITLFWLLGNLRLIWSDLTPLLLIWFCARKKTNNDHKCWNALTKAVFFGKFFTTFMFTLNWILQIWYGERGRRLLACEEQLGGGLGWRRLCEQFFLRSLWTERCNVYFVRRVMYEVLLVKCVQYQLCFSGADCQRRRQHVRSS